ncbi:MAG: hypothetical protein WDZ89_01485 [Gemmatimonadota bacterium]
MAGKKQTQLTVPLMIVAVLLIGGFVYWLNISTEAVRVAIAEEEQAAAAAAEGTEARAVSADDFAQEPAEYVGRLIRLEGLPVFNQMGPEAFTVLLPTDMIYLIHVEGGATVSPGGMASVTGTVEIMSDSVLDAWEARGALDPSQREEAGISETFFEVVEFNIATNAPPPGN